MLAKALALNPLTALAFTAGGNRAARARRLIEGTGSRLSDEGLGYYARLIGDRAHVEGTLAMMAQWDVRHLLDMLPRIDAPCLLITGDTDRAVSPAVSDRAAHSCRTRAAHACPVSAISPMRKPRPTSRR